ncbi:MAG: hypothetical protein ACI4SB_06185 [Acutalibacteraceae bacterium]
MVKTKSYIKKLMSFFMALVLLVGSFSVFGSFSASAAKSGSGKATKVVQVWTNKSGSTPYITLKPQKGTYYYYTWSGQRKTKNMYAYYNVTVKPVSTVSGGRTSEKVQKKVLEDGSLKISLQKYTYYEIIIEYNEMETLNNLGLKLFNPSRGTGWQSNCSWSVSKINNCGNCC